MVFVRADIWGGGRRRGGGVAGKMMSSVDYLRTNPNPYQQARAYPYPVMTSSLIIRRIIFWGRINKDEMRRCRQCGGVPGVAIR